MPSKLLTKSKYISGLQCLKCLWIQINEPEKIPETGIVKQHIFDQGHLVGELAKKMFPDGIDIPSDNFMGNTSETQKLLKQRRPLYEAGILTGSIYSRTDILNPVNENEWDIIEVKQSTSVKDVHIQDASFQKYCWETYGLKIRKCFLALINNKYVKNGLIDPQGLFKLHDITDKVKVAGEGIQNRIDAMLDTIKSSECPEVSIGKYCKDPYDCSLKERCWQFLPEDNIFTLYYGGKKCFDLFNEGILTVKDIPDDYKMGEKQHIQQACVISGDPFVNKERISEFLSSLEYPLYFFDFETIGPAIPLFDGTRPFQNIPFQFSLHIINDGNAKPEHFSFLASGVDDPRPALLKELKKLLGDTGSILTFNQRFEEGILKEMALAFSEYKTWVAQVCNRLVDLLSPFSNFDYYHPSQKGKASLKKVLPALTGKDYSELDIAEGQSASIAFLTVTYGEVTEEERQKVRNDLLKYCGLDTEGMIWIVEKLRDIGR
jgi:hypothetical protein